MLSSLVHYGNCSSGELWLADLSSPLDGRIETRYNNVGLQCVAQIIVLHTKNCLLDYSSQCKYKI